MSRGIAALLALVACAGGKDGAQQCEDVPPDRAIPDGWAATCETDEDCPADFVCEEGAAGGYSSFYELTCTPRCETDDDCPVVVDAFCGDGPYCTMVHCGSGGYCLESTCV